MIQALGQKILLTISILETACLEQKVVKNSNKGKWICSGSRITFDGTGSWSFMNDFARNVIIFVIDNNSSSHADNRRDNFLVLGEGLTFAINGSFGLAEKFSMNFSSVN